MSYYDAWQGAGLSLPDQPEGIQDWRHTVQLSHESPDYLLDGSIKEVAMGLGWDAGCDVDGSVVMFDADHQVVDVVWYQQLISKDGSIKHSGDDRTGEGGGDDEVIRVNLVELPKRVHHLMFVVCVYSEGVSFSQVRSAYVRMKHGKPKHEGLVLCEYNLSELGGTAMLLAMITRRGAFWNFRALGRQAGGRTVLEVVQDPYNLEPLSGIESFDPLVRRIHIAVKEGRKLAIKDKKLFGKGGSSDPYVKLKYKGGKAKSEVIDKDIHPKWNMEPIDMGNVIESEHKAVKITVWDYDLTGDDFMGALRIPAAALYKAGPGSHEWWMPLTKSKKSKYEGANVEGDVLIQILVQDVSGGQ
ncbi:hypothetical protein BSKO_12967 [Bryopsis sp. KO-2023]|nr:hypothetical protein BSKO_12967 [Bryopsis sp. KO-2023]